MKITRSKRTSQQVSKAAIIRSVATSTAIETGKKPEDVASKLKAGTKFRHLSLGK